MRMTTKRVLVTGGAGFVGSHLCERLLGNTRCKLMSPLRDPILLRIVNCENAHH